MDTLDYLGNFNFSIRKYQNFVREWVKQSELSMSISEKLTEDIQNTRSELQRSYSRLENIIVKYTDTSQLTYSYSNNRYNVFDFAFDIVRADIANARIYALYSAIKIVDKVIGKLEAESERAKIPEENVIKKLELPIEIFETMQLHPKVVEASKSCFVTKNYREAILNAFIALIDYVKKISALDLDGDNLMNNAFSFNYDKEQRKITKYPIIRINELKDETNRDEQQGFMFLCKGAAAFMRNTKAHKLSPQPTPLHTLESLAFASLLFKKLDEGKVNIP